MKKLAALGLVLSCGGGTTPQCANNNCTLPSQDTVKFTFDAYPQWQFPMDSCSDLGVKKVQVDATDGTGVVTTLVVDCGNAQATFEGLEAGDYSITVTPLDGGGASLVQAPATAMLTSMGPGTTSSTQVNVPWDSWTGTYTGTFLFRLSWAGQSCAAAAPPVAVQELTLEINGQMFTGMTDTMHHMNGMDPEMCKPLEDNFPESALTVPFGPATLTVVGKDNGGNVHFEHTFDTFVGAGISNPTITYDVPAPADAGVDAPVDAPPDT
jgi:hypothetical protein